MFYNVIYDTKNIYPGILLELLPLHDGKIIAYLVIFCLHTIFFLFSLVRGIFILSLHNVLCQQIFIEYTSIT